MLRITIHDNLQVLTFQLEGMLARPWLRELQDAGLGCKLLQGGPGCSPGWLRPADDQPRPAGTNGEDRGHYPAPLPSGVTHRTITHMHHEL